MRVLALMPDTYAGRGGIALYNRDFLNALCALPECEEVVVLPRLSTGGDEPAPGKLRYLMQALGGKGKYAKAAVAAARTAGPFDLIVCGLVTLLPIAFMLRLRLAAPTILLVYGIDAWWPRGRLVSLLARRCAHFVSISEITKQRFMSWSGVDPGKITVIPNAIDVAAYGAEPKNAELVARHALEGRTVIATLGRMEASEGYKGFDEILEILGRLAQDVPNVVYLAIGDGNDRARLERKASDLRLRDRVIFTGFVSQTEKADYLRLADVFAMPSRGEGFGFVFLEAMACGVPVVAGRDDGGREAVRDGTLGIMVDPADPDDIVRGILAGLEMPRKIPAGLSYFAYPEFERRVHDFIRSRALSASQAALQEPKLKDQRS